jgi:hypothetical protein
LEAHSQRDVGNENILKKGTKTYEQVTRLSIGEMVSFSGTTVGSSYYKYDNYISIDVESVYSPKIIVKFNEIAPFALHSKKD